MMNSTVTRSGCENTSVGTGLGRNREFPSFRLVDEASASSGRRAFAPVRFTLESSKRHGAHAPAPRPMLVRPTLISPPAPVGDGTASKKPTGDAPLFPSMDDFKSGVSPKAGSKRPASQVAPASFLPYKKRPFESITDDDTDEFMRRSPEYLQQLVEAEPRMKEAASILLDMRTLVASDENAKLQSSDESASEESVVFSMNTTESTEEAVSLAETRPNLPAEQCDVSSTTTRTVTPAPRGMRLALPEDAHELNSLHCFVRAELLEVFALPCTDDNAVSSNQCRSARSRRSNGPDGSTSASRSGRVGLRCVYCAHLPRRARAGSTMSSFYPKSLNDIYRSVCTWQRIHFKTCRHIPTPVREGYWQLKDSDRTRGKTRYWVSSAQRIGLVNLDAERGGICFATAPPQVAQT